MFLYLSFFCCPLLLLLLSFAETFLFFLVTTSFVDHCVSGANLCRRRSVAFVHRGKRTQKNAPGIARNIGNVVGERKMHISHGVALSSSVTRMRLECAWDDVALSVVAQPEVLSLFGTSVVMSRGQRGIALSCGQSFRC
uniref:(northern house mosquito) hypothetical protein n=1 Tax=Culex pipiens TaxID=7175 RepID=A0A8D8KDC6_CULPI